MATWGDHPEAVRGYLYIHRPELLKTMAVNEPSGVSYPAGDIDFDGEVGMSTWDKRNTFITASFGANGTVWFPTADFRDYFAQGVCPVFSIDESSNILTLCNAPRGIRPGEINPSDNDQIFIWDDFRPWALPPTFYSYGGGYMIPVRKGGVSSSNTMRGIAHNIGSAGVFTQVGANGYADVDFALDQVSPRVDAPLGSTNTVNWANPSYVLTASSENGSHVAANMKDGSASTYWESTSGSNEWIKVDMGSGNTDALWYAGIQIYTATSFPADIQIDGSNNDADWTPVGYAKISTTVPTGSYYYLMVDNDLNFPIYRYYRFTFGSTQGASYFTIAKLSIGYSDETSVDPDWDIGTAPSYQSGSSSSTSITVRYPPGFYWIRAGDWSETQYWKLARRPVCVLDNDERIATYYGATYDEKNHGAANVVDNAFDGDEDTYWTSSPTDYGFPKWIEVTFPSERTFKGFRILPRNVWPIEFQMQFKNEFSGLYHDAGSWNGDITAGNTWYEFELDAPVTAKTWRLSIDSVSTGYHPQISEIEFIYQYAYGFSQNKVTVDAHSMGIEGQEMTFRIYDDISQYPPGTLVMFREDEYYQGVKGSLSAADPTGQSREGQIFVGWIDERRTHVEATADGKVAYTDIVAYDIAGWAKRLPFTSVVYRNRGSINSTAVFGNDEMGWLPGLHIDSIIFHVLFEFSTLLELADYYHSETWFVYRCPARDVALNSIYGAADGVAQTIAHRLTCNKMGQFKVLPDANLQQSADRTSTTQESIGDGDIVSWDVTRAYTGRVGRHWGSAIIADETIFSDLSAGMTAVFCIAPDVDAWSQGLEQVEFGEQLVIDQTELNNREGQRYSVRSNPEFSALRLKLAHGNDAGIDPARLEPILLTITDESKGPDGWTCTNQRCYPVALMIRRDHKANTKQVELTVEVEVDGVPAQTYTPPS